jgi:hypothetical protein
MIAQWLADRELDRVEILTLMSSTHEPRKLPGRSLKVPCALVTQRTNPTWLAGLDEYCVQQGPLTDSPAYPASNVYLREFFTTSVKCSYRPA